MSSDDKLFVKMNIYFKKHFNFCDNDIKSVYLLSKDVYNNKCDVKFYSYLAGYYLSVFEYDKMKECYKKGIEMGDVWSLYACGYNEYFTVDKKTGLEHILMSIVGDHDKGVHFMNNHFKEFNDELMEMCLKYEDKLNGSNLEILRNKLNDRVIEVVMLKSAC